MKEKISEIDWGSLEHAYGSAENVPDLLIDLQSDDPDIRKRAYHGLFGNIWHQGTVYSSTVYAIPFLFELFDSPETQDKDMLILLLASIASGSGYFQIHQPIFEKWNSNVDGHKNELKQESITIKSIQELISPRFETILEHLTNKESEIRLSVAEATIHYPEHSEKSLFKLKKVLEIETDEDVLESIEEAIEQLSEDK